MNDKLKDILTKALFDLQGQQGYLDLQQTAALYHLTGFPVPAGTAVDLLIKEFQSNPVEPRPLQQGPLQVGDKVRIVSHDDPPEEFQFDGWLSSEKLAFPIDSTATIVDQCEGHESFLFTIKNDFSDLAVCIHKTCLERIEE